MEFFVLRQLKYFVYLFIHLSFVKNISCSSPVMWYDSFDNSEPSQLWQDNETASYQFGTLSEQLSQDDFDELSCQYIQQPMEYNTPRIQTEAWPDMGCSLYIREIPSQYNVPGSSYTAQDVGHAQTTHSQPPEDFETSVTVNCPVREVRQGPQHFLLLQL